jgi:hypothetical protein
MNEQISRIDLHMHSKHSRSANDWLLQTLGANECYTTPKQAYRLAKDRGMNFVTLTDHDCIDGALELAHYEDFFVSEEVTTRFPEDGAKLHVVTLNINEDQHRMIQSLRSNVYELVGYLNSKNIVHFIAHPFFRMGDALTLAHLEKMLLLFSVFEVKNGGKQLHPENLLELLLDGLTPEMLLLLADKHNIQPVGQTAWLKSKVAGSDDHGGILIGYPHTVCPQAMNVTELLDSIREGKSRAEGKGGSPLNVAHAIFAVAFKHSKMKKESFDPFNSPIVWNLLGQLWDTANPEQSLSVTSKVLLFLSQNKDAMSAGKANDSALEILKAQIVKMLRSDEDLRLFLKTGLEFNQGDNERLYTIINKIVNMTLADALAESDSLDAFALVKKLKVLLAVAPLVVPYIIAFRTEHRDKPLMREAYHSLLDHRGNGHVIERVAVFTDGSASQLENSNVLSYYLKPEMDSDAAIFAFGLSDKEIRTDKYRNFRPAATLNLPQIKLPELSLPPFMEIARALAEGDYDKIYMHSLGPMSILGALLGWLMRIPVYSRYPLRGTSHFLRHPADHNQQKVIRMLFKSIFSLIAEVRVLAEMAEKNAMTMGIPAEKIRVLAKSTASLRQKPQKTVRRKLVSLSSELTF